MKSPLCILIISMLFGQSMMAQNDFLSDDNESANKYITDSTYYWLGNAFGQSWFNHKIYRPEAVNSFGDVITAYDYEYDTINLYWYKQRFYEGQYYQDGLRKRWLTFAFDQSGENWRMSDSIYFNQSGKPVTGWYKTWDPVKEQFINGKRSAYFYDGKGRLHIQYNQTFDTTIQNWKRTNYDVHFYNNTNSDSLRYTYSWNNAQQQWNDSIRVSYFYNSDLLLDVEIIQLFIDGNWVNSKLLDYAYSELSLLVLKNELQWDEITNQWANKNQTVYQYNAAQLPESRTDFLWDGSQWLNKTRVKYQYNENNLVEEIVNEYWSFGFEQWVNASLSNYVYDENLNRKQFSFYTWNPMIDDWQNFYREDNYWSFFEASSIYQATPGALRIFPNPATDIVQFNISGENQMPGPVRFLIYDTSGNLVKTLQAEALSGIINITELKPGIYPVTYFFNTKTGSTVLIKN